MAKKLGLCLGAGGARGVAHAGFLQALIENNIDIDVVTGCSMGAIVGALYLCGYSTKDMYDIAINLKKSDIFDVSALIIRNRALFKSQKFDKLLEDFFGEKTIQDLPKPFACISSDLVTGEIHPFYEGELKIAVRASASMPLIFTPVEFKDMILVDGALCNRIPVKEARKLGAEVVVAVDVLAGLTEEYDIDNIFQVGMRALDVLCANINIVDNEQKPDLLVVPDLGKTSQYKLGSQEFCFETGYKEGLKHIAKIKELLQ